MLFLHSFLAIGFLSVSGVIANDTTSGGLTCTHLHPKNTYCYVAGSVKNAAVIRTFPAINKAKSCRNACWKDSSCESFSYDTSKGVCTMYSKSVASQKFTPGPTGVYFWRRRCFSCQAVATSTTDPTSTTPSAGPTQPPGSQSCTSTFSLVGASQDGFNAARQTFSARLSCISGEGVLADLDPTQVVAFASGYPIDNLNTDAHSITFPGFDSGFITISIYALDVAGNAVTASFPLVFGYAAMPVLVLDDQQRPVAGALVEGTDATYTGVSQTVTTDANGKALLINLPDSTLNLLASTSGNDIAVKGLFTTTSQVVLQLLRYDSVDNDNNLDFGSGLAGWSGGTLTNHMAKRDTDEDLIVETFQNTQLRTVSTTFAVPFGSKEVFIRYKFQTDEFPGGYYGSQYNDYYQITLRTDNGGLATITNSMNQFGIGAFDPTGATDWFTLSMSVPAGANSAQVDVSVSNVGDGYYQSRVIVDKAGINGCDACADCSTCPDKAMCQNVCQNPAPQTCSFYRNCLEATIPCANDPSGYAMSYGERQCNAYRSAIDAFSASGQNWVWGVQSCLQNALVPIAEQCSSTCKSIHDTAFSAHQSCYFNNGFCSLPTCDDYVAILATMSTAGLQDSTTTAGSSINWCAGHIQAVFSQPGCQPALSDQLRVVLKQAVFKVLQQIPSP